MSTVFALILACLAYLGQINIETTPGPVTLNTGAQALGKTGCIDHTPKIAVNRDFSGWESRVLAHEMLHAVDCRDDGTMNGSPLTGGAHGVDPAHEWVNWALAHPGEAVNVIGALSR